MTDNPTPEAQGGEKGKRRFKNTYNEEVYQAFLKVDPFTAKRYAGGLDGFFWMGWDGHGFPIYESRRGKAWAAYCAGREKNISDNKKRANHE